MINSKTLLFSINDLLLEPHYGECYSRQEIKIDKKFLYSAPMDTVTGYELAEALLKVGQIPVISREIADDEYITCLEDFAETDTFFASGVTSEEQKRFVERVTKSGKAKSIKTINVAIDIAHGWSKPAIDFHYDMSMRYEWINKWMSGSIATPIAAIDLIQKGFDTLRIGIGPGSVCTTRVKTGVGVPLATSIDRIYTSLKAAGLLNKATLIADGGIKYPGDVAKYLALGADAVMLGSVFSKAKESYGWMKSTDEFANAQYMKVYRGHASYLFQQEKKNKEAVCPEGTHTTPFIWDGRTTVKSICDEYTSALQSTCSYLGLSHLSFLNPTNAIINLITSNSYIEGLPHNELAQSI